MDSLVTIEQIITIAKDVGIAALVLFVFYRYIIAQGKDSERSDALQNSLIALNTKAIAAFEKISDAMERMSASQEHSNIVQERAGALQEQALQRHIDNGRNIIATVDAVKELGLNWKNYNALVDGTVSILSGNVAEMRSSVVSILGRMQALEEAVNSLKDTPCDESFRLEIEGVKEKIENARTQIIHAIERLNPPPTEPDAANVRPFPTADADAGAQDAAKLDTPGAKDAA